MGCVSFIFNGDAKNHEHVFLKAVIHPFDFAIQASIISFLLSASLIHII